MSEIYLYLYTYTVSLKTNLILFLPYIYYIYFNINFNLLNLPNKSSHEAAIPSSSALQAAQPRRNLQQLSTQQLLRCSKSVQPWSLSSAAYSSLQQAEAAAAVEAALGGAANNFNKFAARRFLSSLCSVLILFCCNCNCHKLGQAAGSKQP